MDVPASAMGGGQADLIVPPKALDQIRRLFGGDEDMPKLSQRLLRLCRWLPTLIWTTG
jgi:hypothetical protein